MPLPESNLLGGDGTFVEASLGDLPRITNGQTVHWTADGDCKASIVTHIYDDGTTVDLVAFVGGVFFMTNVAKGDVGQVATWHLPTDHSS